MLAWANSPYRTRLHPSPYDSPFCSSSPLHLTLVPSPFTLPTHPSGNKPHQRPHLVLFLTPTSYNSNSSLPTCISSSTSSLPICTSTPLPTVSPTRPDCQGRTHSNTHRFPMHAKDVPASYFLCSMHCSTSLPLHSSSPSPAKFLMMRPKLQPTSPPRASSSPAFSPMLLHASPVSRALVPCYRLPFTPTCLQLG